MKYYAASDTGLVRKQNEDYIYASPEQVGVLSNLFIVADGMGGHKAGEYASRFAVSTAVKVFMSEKDGGSLRDLFKKAVSCANMKVYNSAADNLDFRGMGTTMVLATIIGDDLFAANIGDSRLYVIGKEIRQITKDHSLVEELACKGVLDRNSDEYNINKNIITRAVGSSYDVEADFFETKLQPGDKVLLCSDGLTNMIDDQGIFDIIKNNPKTEDCVKQLMFTGKKNGGSDNISLIVIDPEL